MITATDNAGEFQVRDGRVVVTSRLDGSFTAECGRCGAAMGATAYVAGDDYDDYPDTGLDEFTDRHRDCGETSVAEEYGLPSPAAMPTETPQRPTVWVVQQISGGRLRVLAEWHSPCPRPDGTELRFYNQRGNEGRQRVATVRAGSWHWCVAESALEPKADQS